MRFMVLDNMRWNWSTNLCTILSSSLDGLWQLSFLFGGIAWRSKVVYRSRGTIFSCEVLNQNFRALPIRKLLPSTVLFTPSP
jgi:hypothetical protein